jgi:pimeloyl-ACP methyl ester carboxylesterase
MKAYLIPGIGADYRLFTHLRLPEGYEPVHIHWISPLEDEPLPAYARRLCSQIDTSEPFILIGLSLGGIMSVEIAKIFPPVCTILISSIPLSAHLPGYYALAQNLRLPKITPPALFKAATSLKHFLTMKSAGNRKIMQDVIWSGDDQFIRWGVEAVLKWENDVLPHPLFHIHGSRDEIFPISRTTPTHIVPKGGHMIIMSQPELTNTLLDDILRTLTPAAQSA